MFCDITAAVHPKARLPVWVNRVVLTVCRSLPVPRPVTVDGPFRIVLNFFTATSERSAGSSKEVPDRLAPRKPYWRRILIGAFTNRGLIRKLRAAFFFPAACPFGGTLNRYRWFANVRIPPKAADQRFLFDHTERRSSL